jgi:broad specificity phosphatase PhoE
MISTTVYLARHGQSAWNHRKMISGQLDPALSPEGLLQAEALAVAMGDIPLAAIYCSTLVRSRDTARIVAAGRDIPVRERADLAELNWGAMQGRFRDHRDPEAEALWKARKTDPLGFAPPGGETFAALMSRVKVALSDIIAAHGGDNVLIVGHRNTNRALLSELMRWTAEEVIRLPVSQHTCYRIETGSSPSMSQIRFVPQSALTVTSEVTP